jgi:hypothetical protein
VKSDVPGQELFNAVDWVIGNLLEHVAEISFRIQSIQFCRAEESVEGSGTLASRSDPANK